MKSISKYRSEKACYYAVFSLTETYTFQTRLEKKLVKLASSQNVKKRLQYSIYNTSWFTPWSVFLIIFSKIHTTFHTKFRLFVNCSGLAKSHTLERTRFVLSL